jgi:hypothetical protein
LSCSTAHASTRTTPHAHSRTLGHLGLLDRLQVSSPEGIESVPNLARHTGVHRDSSGGQHPESIGANASGDDSLHSFARNKLSRGHAGSTPRAAMRIFHRLEILGIRISDEEISASSKTRVDVTVHIRHKS